jgi:glycosyltransferase involved in cell wall biosynthesis
VLVADDPAAFADALRAVLDDPALARALIDAGRRAVQAFTADQVEETLRSLVWRR